MATRGSSKALSVDQEDFIARKYGGKRSLSSGASDTDAGDVRTDKYLIECKVTGRPTAPAKSTLLKTFEKIAEEAYEEGREPLVALRFYNPDSILANSDGWVDLVVRRVGEDVELVDKAWRYEELCD
jgi:hypothetical protein